MIQEYYRQMRKFGCNILAVVQQYDIIKDSAVRGAMIGNSKMLSTVGFNEMKGKPVEFGCQSFGRMAVVPSLVLTGAIRYLAAGTNSGALDRLGQSDRSRFTPKHAFASRRE